MEAPRISYNYHHLPADIWRMLIGRLGPRELARLSCCSRPLRNLVSQAEDLWKDHFIKKNKGFCPHNVDNWKKAYGEQALFERNLHLRNYASVENKNNKSLIKYFPRGAFFFLNNQLVSADTDHNSIQFYDPNGILSQIVPVAWMDRCYGMIKIDERFFYCLKDNAIIFWDGSKVHFELNQGTHRRFSIKNPYIVINDSSNVLNIWDFKKKMIHATIKIALPLCPIAINGNHLIASTPYAILCFDFPSGQQQFDIYCSQAHQFLYSQKLIEIKMNKEFVCLKHKKNLFYFSLKDPSNHYFLKGKFYDLNDHCLYVVNERSKPIQIDLRTKQTRLIDTKLLPDEIYRIQVWGNRLAIISVEDFYLYALDSGKELIYEKNVLTTCLCSHLLFLTQYEMTHSLSSDGRTLKLKYRITCWTLNGEKIGAVADPDDAGLDFDGEGRILSARHIFNLAAPLKRTWWNKLGSLLK